jgi:outer membrane protein TolC
VAARDSEIEVALERLTIAERSVAQGAEAHRIVARKYEGGLAAIVELLGAAATETSTRLGLAQAQYQAIVADAGRRQARGGDPAALAALEE